MTTQNANFSIVRGDTIKRKIFVRDDDGVAINLVNRSILFTAKKSIIDSDDNAVLKKTFTFEEGDTEALVGLGYLRFTSEETEIPPSVYYYDIQLVDNSADVPTIETILFGKFIVAHDVTRRVE
ncbi:hypothetical protein [Candidatus Magnetaquicoccus inordinatus]|uniref:hypothetical protein n=1 Tax=Candidatus Magnetaquicoccus inordinatus TaxID=2496818 RepID=UPI00102AB635|nr:hypothetical protein [Candidatus Magnetaquicoccus inordinatus]